MRGTKNRLSARTVESLKQPSVVADGGGLYLRVKSATAKSWIFVWHACGARKEMGLGSWKQVSLALARDLARQAREAVASGQDPAASRKPAGAAPTFGTMADSFIATRTPSVKSSKSVARWERCIGEGGYADGLRSRPVDKVTTADVLAVLRPLWHTHPSTAGCLRGYVEAVLNMAKAAGYRSGENPAAWAGHLALILPARKRLTRGHHAAMAYENVPVFMSELAKHKTLASAALQLTILCATRTSETLQATWGEFDLDRSLWTIPATRMKAGKSHRIPISEAVVELLAELPRHTDLVFPGRAAGRPLSGMAMEMMLRRMKTDVTVHGFRSSFRDWAGEATETPREVCEAALAHTVGNSAELAYRRGDALDKRKLLMEAWGAYCVPSNAADRNLPQAANAA
jgi:integrase